MSVWMVLAGIVGAWVGMWLWRRKGGRGRSAQEALLEGTAQAMRGKYPQAIALLSQAIEKEPSWSDAWMHRGIAYLESGQVEAALQDLETCLRLDPGKALGYYNRALAWLEKGEEERALGDLEAARRLEPGDVEVHLWRGIVLSRRGEYEKALEAVEEVIRLGDERRGYQNQAVILEQAGRWEEALASWDEVLKRDKGNVMALCRRGLLREKLGWREAARDDLRKAAKRGKQLPERWRQAVMEALGRLR